MKPRLLLLITEDWYFWSHRRAIAQAARDVGFEVLVATRGQEYIEQIESEGFRFIPIRLRRSSRHPIRELLSILELVRIYKREQPDIVHHVAVKPILYGSWAARLAGVPAVVNAVAGLGHVFVAEGWRAQVLRWIIIPAYRSALSTRNSRVIFQNPDDMQAFIHAGMAKAEQAILIRGTGVDVSTFLLTPEANGPPIVMLASRMLWTKGVRELVEAARLLKRDGLDFHLVLVGIPDPENPASVPEEQLREWQAEGIVEWWGLRRDMPEVVAQASIVVLPSYYREGVPKILLEGAASGRPIVATDVPGCREIVRDGENGFLVPSQNVEALAGAVARLIRDPGLRRRMGIRGRAIAVAEFSAEQVRQETLALYRELLSGQSPAVNQVGN